MDMMNRLLRIVITLALAASAVAQTTHVNNLQADGNINANGNITGANIPASIPGAGACVNQFVRVLNNGLPPTCATVGTADLAASLGLVTPNIGVATGTSVNVSGTVAGSNIPVGTINSGAGTTNTIPKYTSGVAGVLGNSSMTDDGTTVTIPEAVNITSTNNPLTVGSCDIWIDSSQNIQTVLNTCPLGGTFRLEQGNYNQNANHITLKSGQNIVGMGQFATRILCTGAGPCISADSTTAASIRDLQIQIDTNAGAKCWDQFNTTGDSKWNRVEGVECQTTSGTMVAGQEGFAMHASTAFAMYWNYFIAVQVLNLETGFHCTITGAGPLTNNNGCNDNQFFGVSCHFFKNCIVFDKWATENRVVGITGSASGNLANNTLVTVGDGVNPADNNMIYVGVSDTGTAGQNYQVLAGVSRTVIDGVVDAGGRASTNASSTTMVKNFRNVGSQADLYPNGTASNPPIGDLAAPTTGTFFSPGGLEEISALGTADIIFTAQGPMTGNTMGYGWAAAADPNGTRTTNLGNPAAGTVSADTTTVGNSLGRFKSSTTQLLEAAAPSGVAGSGVTWEDSSDHMLKFNPNNGGEQHVSQIYMLTAQYTNSTTGFTTVGTPNIAFPVNASQKYTAECHLYYQAASTGGLNIQFTGPASPTAVAYGLNDPVSATTFGGDSVATAFGTSLGSAVTTAATNFDAQVSFALVNGTNAGTVTLQAKSSAAVQLQIQAGSFCQVQ